MNLLDLLTPLDWASVGLALLFVLISGQHARNAPAAQAGPTTDPVAAAGAGRYVGPGAAALALTLLADPAMAAATPLPLDLPALTGEDAASALDPAGAALAQALSLPKPLAPPGAAAAGPLAGRLFAYALIIALLIPALLRLLR